MANWPIDYRQYPDSVVKAIQLSNQEAQNSRLDGIAPEHLLLAMVKEGVSIGARILIKSGFDLRRIRLEVEKRVESPAKVKVGKRPMLPETLSVLETARRESNELRDFVAERGHHIGSVGILLGLLRVKNTLAYDILQDLTVDEIREEGFRSVAAMIAQAAADPSGESGYDT